MSRVEEKTEAVYAFIKAYIAREQRPPTMREIRDGCGISLSSVLRHLDRLSAQGRIYREPGKARTIRLLEGHFELEEMTQNIYHYIRRCIEVVKLPPTRDEIGAEFFISRDTARRHLYLLESRGLIRLEADQVRGIRLTTETETD